MEWYIIEFELLDNSSKKHYLGYLNGNFILVREGDAKLFSQKAIDNDEKLKEFLKTKKYKLTKPKKIYEIMKYRY